MRKIVKANKTANVSSLGSFTLQTGTLTLVKILFVLRIHFHLQNVRTCKCIYYRQQCFTTDVRQPWTNYANNGNKRLIVGADVRSEYSNIRYLHLIIGKAQKFVSGDKYDF